MNFRKFYFLIEGARTIESVKNIKKFKDIPEQVFFALDELDFEKIGNGSYLEWVLNRYLTSSDGEKSRFVEDLYKIKDDLVEFHSKKNKQFWNHPKDINQYKSFRELFGVVHQYKDYKSKSDLKVKSSQVPKEDLNLVYENKDWLIFSPKTQEASCVLGRNTRWCTASQGDRNMFDQYNKQGPLYILIDKQNKDLKFQFHFESRQYMDVNDDDINGLTLDDDIIDFFLNKGHYEILNFAYKDKLISTIKGIDNIKKLGIMIFETWEVMGVKDDALIIGKYSNSSDLADEIQIKDDSKINTSAYVKQLDDMWELFDFSYREVSIDEMLDEMSLKVTKALDSYAESIGYEDAKDYLENELEDSQEIERLFLDAEMSGTESEAYKSVMSDLNDINDMGMWVERDDEGNFILLSDGTGLGEDDYAVEEYDGFEIGVPYYGFSGFDEEYYNSELMAFINSKRK